MAEIVSRLPTTGSSPRGRRTSLATHCSGSETRIEAAGRKSVLTSLGARRITTRRVSEGLLFLRAAAQIVVDHAPADQTERIEYKRSPPFARNSLQPEPRRPPYQCKQAEQSARPGRCCNRGPKGIRAEGPRSAAYFFLAGFFALVLALVDFFAGFLAAAIVQDSCHTGFRASSEGKRLVTIGTPESDGSRRFVDWTLINRFFTEGIRSYDKRMTRLICGLEKVVKRNFFTMKLLARTMSS